MEPIKKPVIRANPRSLSDLCIEILSDRKYPNKDNLLDFWIAAEALQNCALKRSARRFLYWNWMWGKERFYYYPLGDGNFADRSEALAWHHSVLEQFRKRCPSFFEKFVKEENGDYDGSLTPPSLKTTCEDQVGKVFTMLDFQLNQHF